MTFNNKVIWVTGAAGGIGKALTHYLSQYNCKLIISDIQEQALNDVKLACKTPKNVAILPLNLEQHKQLPEKVNLALSFFGTIDMLVNNAGVSQRSLILETDIDVDKRLFDINYFGTIALTKALLPHFVKQKSGHFVTTTSLMGKFSSPYRSSYCGAKHALHGFFDVLRMEHQNDNVKVTIICPGFVNTNIAKNAFVGDGSRQQTQDSKTAAGMSPDNFAIKMAKAIKAEKFEAYIGGKETLAVHIKRFFPKLLHKVILKSSVK